MVAVAGTGWVLAPSLVAYVLEADRYYPQRDRSSDGSIGDLSHQARVSDHNPVGGLVHAVDLDEDLAPGLDLDGFAEKLRRQRDPRVKYVIYEGRMFSSYATSSRAAWAWGPYSGINAHMHHLHLSILDTYAAEHDLSPWGFAPVTAPVPTPNPAPPIDLGATDMAIVIRRIENPKQSVLIVPDKTTKIGVRGFYAEATSAAGNEGILGADEVKVDKGAWDKIFNDWLTVNGAVTKT